MILSKVTVKRPYATLMFFIAVLILGVISTSMLPLDLLPEIEIPTVTVIIPYPGASASDVENDVTKHLEDALSTVPNLKEINSNSVDNMSIVSCEFDWGTDLDVATSDIRDSLDMARNTINRSAPDSQEPIIFKFSTDMIPVMALAVSAEESWRDLDYIVDRDIMDPLQRTPGVGNIAAYGGLKRQIKIILNWESITAYNIPPSLIIRRLEEENMDMPLGKIKEGRRDYFLRITGRLKDASEIEGILLKDYNGRPLYLKDVAKVVDGYAEETAKSYQDGNEAIFLSIQKQSGANTVNVARNLQNSISKIESDLPPDVRIAVAFDSSDYIVMTLSNLINTVITAGLIVVFITFLFLRRWNASFIVFLAIPFSLIVALTLIYARGLTINMISLMSLAIAIGMVVDNTIVVLENISRHIEEGQTPLQASIEGTAEVGGAITASTITTIAVFVPLVFATGITGIMFKQLAFIVSTAIFSSLFVALTLTPMLTSIILKKPKNNGKDSRFHRVGELLLKRMEHRYSEILKFCLHNKAMVLIPLIAVFFTSLYLGRFLKTEFFPSSDTGQLEISFSLNESARLEETNRIMLEIGETIDRETPDRLFWYGRAGEVAGGMGAGTGGSDGPNSGTVGVKYSPADEREENINDIARDLREEISRIPGIERFSVSVTGGMGGGMASGKPLEVELTGMDIDSMNVLAARIETIMKSVEGTVDVEISFKDPRLEMHIKIDKEKAQQMGTSTAAVGQVLRTYFYGYEATRLRDDGEDFEVFVQLSEKERFDVSRIGEVPLPTNSGTTISLKEIADIDFGIGPVQLDRKNRQRLITVGCDIYRRAMSEVQADIEAGLANLEVPQGITIEMGGEAREQREAFSELTYLMLLGILLVYMVMAGQFESLKTPFIIFFAIPFAFIGVIWALLITSTTFSIMSFMATITLIGVVVNNAIVLVDYTNLLRKRGLAVREAVIQAGARRLRPVLITMFTTSFGMLPLALGTGTGGEMWQPFGVTAMGGLLLSGIITLLLVPVVYSIINKD